MGYRQMENIPKILIMFKKTYSEKYSSVLRKNVVKEYDYYQPYLLFYYQQRNEFNLHSVVGNISQLQQVL